MREVSGAGKANKSRDSYFARKIQNFNIEFYSVADPGFPRGGGVNSRRRQPIIWPIILAK